VVAERLRTAFGVESEVIPPPIDTARFRPREGESILPGEFYLVLSRLATYKRTELAVEACTRLGRKLVIVGDGPDRKRLEAMAGPTISFMGRLSDPAVEDHVRRCSALLFPGEEDFGMAPLEINAAGKPVIAFRGGGATETVREGLNGIFFNEATAESLADAILHFEGMEWNPTEIQQHAETFSLDTFQQRFFRVLNRVAPNMVHVRS
jgi:glycosyltransferase involved in cell wall biosynthesis